LNNKPIGKSMGIREYLIESSLSRLWKHNEEHDCGGITAFRLYTNCGYMDNKQPCYPDKPPVRITRKENDKRNKALMADLIKMGYKGATKLVGSYLEGGVSTKEISFFVVDFDNKGTLENDLIRLGKKYEQDTILFVPKGSIQNKDKAYLVGTNNCPNNDTKIGQKMIFNRGKVGYDSPFYTSRVNGRPLIFEGIELYEGLGFSSGSNAMMAGRYAEEYEKKK